jgi:hypothetical protein
MAEREYGKLQAKVYNGESIKARELADDPTFAEIAAEFLRHYQAI